IKNISISFTTSYGAKSILLACKDEEEGLRSMENISGNLRKEEVASDSTPPSKKRRTFAVAIGMQKITFLGLQNIVKCVNAHLKQLESLTDNVNKCAQYLIREIELKLPVSYVNQEIIKLTLRGNYDEIERNVSSNAMRVLTRELRGECGARGILRWRGMTSCSKASQIWRGGYSHVQENKKYHKKGKYCHEQKQYKKKTDSYKTKSFAKSMQKARWYMLQRFFDQDIA
ncbi:hypothetical protein ALC57_08614, partial [Trachymyrmex cornetzi]